MARGPLAGVLVAPIVGLSGMCRVSIGLGMRHFVTLGRFWAGVGSGVPISSAPGIDSICTPSITSPCGIAPRLMTFGRVQP